MISRIRFITLLLSLFLAGLPGLSAQEVIPAPEEPKKTVVLASGFLNQEILFKPLLADPRNFQYSTGLRFGDRAYRAYEYDAGGNWTGAVGKEYQYWVFSFGDRIGLYQWNGVLDGKLSIGIEGGAWSVFALRYDRRPGDYFTSMINIDFRIGIPITWTNGTVSYKVSVYHQSTHLGDELMAEMEKAGQTSARVNPSVEILDAAVSWMVIPQIRLYLLLGVHLTTDATYPVKPFILEYGAEFTPFGVLKADDYVNWMPYAAVHLRNWEDHAFAFDVTAVIGIEFSSRDTSRKYRFRVFGEYHNGNSFEGQFSKNKTDYFNVLLSFGF